MSIAETTEGGAGLVPGVPAADIAKTKSVLERVKERRREQSDEDVLTLDIPSWDGALKANYKVIARSELEKILKRLAKGAKDADATAGDIDFLIKACVGVIAYDEETGESEEVAAGYGLQLAEVLDHQAETAREVVLHLMKYNGIAIGAHAQRVALWMQDTSRSVNPSDPQ